jgi:hypothetical protein
LVEQYTCVTRERKLREVLNVRLDEPLAREIARIAGGQRRSESDVARTLLGYGIEVLRRLEAERLGQPFEWQQEMPDPEDQWPTTVEITARRRPMTDEEVDRAGLREFVGGYRDDVEFEGSTDD